jgi:hypothetical protein
VETEEDRNEVRGSYLAVRVTSGHGLVEWWQGEQIIDQRAKGNSNDFDCWRDELMDEQRGDR